MASKAPAVARYRPRHDRVWRRRKDRRAIPPQQPAVAMLAIIPSLPRPELARLVQRLIDRMDDMDGDPDLELNGDESDHTGAEDDYHNQGWSPLPWGGPGCPVSDPGGGNVEDEAQAGAGQDYYPERPLYGIDQSLGPINGHIVGQRFQLLEQLDDLERDGRPSCLRYAGQVRRRLARLDKEEAAIIAANFP